MIFSPALRHRAVVTVLSASLSSLGLFSVLELSRLGQGPLLWRTAWLSYLLMVVSVLFFYDVHQKAGHTVALWKLHGSKAILRRLEHLVTSHHVSTTFNYLVLPTFLYWSVVVGVSNTRGFPNTQTGLATIGVFILTVLFWHIHEIISRKKERVDHELFVTMSSIKVLTVGLTYGVAFSRLRYDCLDPMYFVGVVFCATFLLTGQALFQDQLIKKSTVLGALVISGIQAALGYLVYRFWGFNQYTAGVALTTTYFAMWGLYHERLRHTLTRRTLTEIILISLLALAAVSAVTNFKAQLIGSCF